MRDAVWDVDSDVSKEARIGWGAYWRHLVNMIESSVCDGDAAFLSNYFDHFCFWWLLKRETTHSTTRGNPIPFSQVTSGSVQ